MALFSITTPDHRILKKSGEWCMTGDLSFGDELMPFYRIKANPNISKQKINQFPRIHIKMDGSTKDNLLTSGVSVRKYQNIVVLTKWPD